MTQVITAYKLARPDGWDFYTGRTIQYRAETYPHEVVVPGADAAKGICSSGVGHASENPNDCFVGAKIPCSAYRLEFEPVCGGKDKWGWLRATVLEEITDLDTLFGWRYSEAVRPVNPLALPMVTSPTPGDLALFRQWASVRASVWDSVGASVSASVWASVWDSVGASVSASVRDSVGASVRASVRASVWASVGDSVRASVSASVGDSVGAYIGSLFPEIREWQHAPPGATGYPYQPAVDLWKRGLVPSYDGTVWRLHSGPKGASVWQDKA